MSIFRDRRLFSAAADKGSARPSPQTRDPSTQAVKAVARQPAASGQGPASTAGAPGSSGDGGSPRPFYAGLRSRYPDADAIPEALVQRLRNSLFGRPVRPREATGRRALARPLQGAQLADYYFLPPREVPGFHSEEREYELSKALNRRHKKEAGGEEEGGKKKKK
ncbi:hypothetical protein HYH03_019100 [Edaphochlamys debaryana]|uniref:Uncharacterized protein n=1 Tax=Edaphochlamys debaryana TaxID=47281 RepID=A0A836BMB6_9CHLO|nr:hypothetical protein HYH03_019100 [Edaphochlamys debaryana]|eukprot:KAG2481946.1 hypothetical protein HYH03_019100 [Edaphochlamys debaryana]